MDETFSRLWILINKFCVRPLFIGVCVQTQLDGPYKMNLWVILVFKGLNLSLYLNRGKQCFVSLLI
jgi:hypothetical protein